MNRTSLLYWWPKVKDLGIPVPKTVILETDRQTLRSVLEGPWPAHLAVHVYEAARQIGFPLFLRTDMASGKHGWKETCYVDREEILLANARGVIEENEIGIIGLDYRALVFREILDLESYFLAFRGDLPIARERRYFIRDGRVECHHPYWPEDAIRHPSRDDWRVLLVNLNHQPFSEIELLTSHARKVGTVLDGYWSVDFAMTHDGTWWLIDMAEGQKSWHPPCSRYGDD